MAQYHRNINPEVVDQKERVGDWEIDTVIVRNHKRDIVTMNDRRTGLLRLRLVSSKEAVVVTIAAVEALSAYGTPNAYHYRR